MIPILAREQPCGCIVCRCEDEQHCHGCGAKKCGATDCVLKDPNDPRAMYSIPNSHPLARVAKLVEALDAAADRLRFIIDGWPCDCQVGMIPCQHEELSDALVVITSALDEWRRS